METEACCYGSCCEGFLPARSQSACRSVSSKVEDDDIVPRPASAGGSIFKLDCAVEISEENIDEVEAFVRAYRTLVEQARGEVESESMEAATAAKVGTRLHIPRAKRKRKVGKASQEEHSDDDNDGAELD